MMQDVEPQNMSDLSAIMRILGNLYYRHPDSPQLSSLFELIRTGKLYDSWPIEQADLFKRLENHKLVDIASAYDKLFHPQTGKISLQLDSERVTQLQTLEIEEIKGIALAVGMPVTPSTDFSHYGFHWLLLAWIETALYTEQVKLAESEEQHSEEKQALVSELRDHMIHIFEALIEPFSQGLLGKIEAYTESDFYKVLAIITREVNIEIGIIINELEENE